MIKDENSSANGWNKNSDGYYYYDEIVETEKTTENLILKIDTKNIQGNNIIVISEITGVVYSEGNPYNEWDKQIDIVE